MAKRGKVLRDPYAGPGLMIVEGQQFPFCLEGMWQSEVPPKPGLAVDVEFDAHGNVTRITAVPEAQLAKEQAEIALAAAKQRGTAWVSRIVTKFGLPQLIAAGLLILSWWFLPAASVDLPFLGKLEFTFWQVLGLLNSGNLSHALERQVSPSAGFYGFLALAAIVGPFVHHYWKDRRAMLGGMLPLFFVLLIGILVRSNLQATFTGSADNPYQIVQRQAQEQLMQAISIGLGAYVSLLSSLYFAAVGLKKFLSGKESAPTVLEKTQQAAA